MTEDEIKMTLSMGEPLSEIVGENVDKLVDYFTKTGAKRIHFSWEPQAKTITPDERAAIILRSTNEIESYYDKPLEQRMYDSILSVYRQMEALRSVVDGALEMYSYSTESHYSDSYIDALREASKSLESMSLFELRNYLSKKDLDDEYG